MKTLITLFVGSLLCAELSAYAEKIDPAKLPPPSSRKDVVFDKDIRPLFEASCTLCHSGDHAKEGLHLDTIEGALKGGKHGLAIKPGKSAESSLVLAISQLDPRSMMPPKPHVQEAAPDAGKKKKRSFIPQPLTAEQVGLVRAWIDLGAK